MRNGRLGQRKSRFDVRRAESAAGTDRVCAPCLQGLKDFSARGIRNGMQYCADLWIGIMHGQAISVHIDTCQGARRYLLIIGL
jgi:hypothetical protein